MCLLGDPDYLKMRRCKEAEIKRMKDNELIFSYTMIIASFSFPDNVKYPSIPCKVDEGTTVYPLNGKGYLTGAEYVLAKSQGCEMKILEAVVIPFKGVGKDSYKDMKKLCREGYKPFLECVRDLQALRSKYPKGSIENLLYKELVNAIYGLLSKGIGNKMTYDTKTGKTTRVVSNQFTNPLLCSWITSFIRSVIGELLHNVDKFGGKVVSVTTDGFLTDIQNLEEMVVNGDDKVLLSIFREIRTILCNNPTALELKTECKGIIS
jgi:hypothetical protein